MQAKGTYETLKIIRTSTKFIFVCN